MMSILKSFSFDMETIHILDELGREFDIAHSKLARILLKYFYENKDILEELIKKDSDKILRRKRVKKNGISKS
jgi:hypothetical protein